MLLRKSNVLYVVIVYILLITDYCVGIDLSSTVSERARIYRDDDTIQLAATLADVTTFTSVSITGIGTGSTHSLNSFRYYIHTVDDNTLQLKEHFNDVTAITLSATGTRLIKLHNCHVVNIDGSAISSGTTITLSNHGLLNYETVKYINYSGGTDIGGLTNGEI